MTRQIVSIKVLPTKWNTYVYVNFDDGRFGTHTYDKREQKWIDSGLKAEELAEAKRLAVKDRKWTNWRRSPRSVAPAAYVRDTDGDARDDLEAMRHYVPPQTTERAPDDGAL